MTTTKELLEAHAYARRRLVAALLSGSPTMDRPGPSAVRTTVIGAVLAALLVAPSAAYAYLAP